MGANTGVTSNSVRMTHVSARFLDGSEERLNALAPLSGYAEGPLVSLKAAVEKLPKSVYDVDSRAWTAMERCTNPSNELTRDESAAIVLYTIEWDPGHPSLYAVLNKALRHEDRGGLTPWFPYLKLILTGLFKLPSICCTVWRVVHGDLRTQYIQGETITWWGFSSCTSTLNVLQHSHYWSTSGPRTLFLIDCVNGKNIRRHSYFAQEDEVLLLPCTHLQVIGHLTSRENLHIIHLREVSPPVMLLKPPNPMTSGKRNMKYL